MWTPTTRPPAARRLTSGEWAELSRGLPQALGRAGVTPQIMARVHPAARLAAFSFGAAPILARPQRIWWPGAPADLAGTAAMAILQHELQHLLDYADGRLSAAGYLLRPANWRYAYDLTTATTWDALGAEQRASVAEHLWQAEQSGDTVTARALRRLLPWGVGLQ